MSDSALIYPEADRDDTIDILHGVRVADPYRYLEDPDGPRTAAFVKAQNALSRPYLAGLPGQAQFAAHMTSLLTAPRLGVPWQRGNRYFMIANPGQLDQDQVFVSGSLTELADGRGRLLIDPNTWSADGTAALTGLQISDDGELAGYTRSDAGSDWKTIGVIDVGSGQELSDRLVGAKWLEPTWMPDGSSFLYWHYPEVSVPSDAATDSGAYTDATGVGQLSLHRLGQPQSEDEVIWLRPEAREWMVDPWVSDDGRLLVLTASPGTDSRTTVLLRHITTDAQGRSQVLPGEVSLVPELADAHTVVGLEGDQLYLRTERDAPAGRLVAVDLAGPGNLWRTVLEGSPDKILTGVAMARDAFVCLWSVDTASRLEITGRDGAVLASPELGELDALVRTESLVADGTTTAGQLAVHGRSNGGLLVGAAITQRPELFAAALPTVGVMDMLRFHLFTIGWAWTTEFGTPDVASDFEVLRRYSPLHAIQDGVRYPPTLISTGDHDDRVVPAHSLKFGAQMQFSQAGDAPVLMRIDTRAGHGVGKPARVLAQEYVDQLAFAAHWTGLQN